MKRNIKLILFLLLIVICSVSLPAQDGGRKQRTISWWISSYNTEGDEFTRQKRKIIEDFEAANPNVKIQLSIYESSMFDNRLLAAMVGGNPPDIIHSWGDLKMTEWVEMGMIKDISDFINKNLAEKINPGLLRLYEVDGKYYGFPYDLGTVHMYYNKDIFSDCGVAVPETFDDLLKIIPKIREKGYIPIAVGAGDRWPAHFWWAYLVMRIGGEKAFTDLYCADGSFTDEAFIKAGEKLLELTAIEPFQEGFLSSTYSDAAGFMGSGQAAMELMGFWAESVYEYSYFGDYVGKDSFGIFPFPAVQGGAGSSGDLIGGGFGYVVGKNAPNAAFDFIEFMLSEEYLAEAAAIDELVPAVTGCRTEYEGNYAEMEKMIHNTGYFQLYFDQFLPYNVGEVMNDAVIYLLSGAGSPAEAAVMIDNEWQDEYGR